MEETGFENINLTLDSGPDEAGKKYLAFWADGQLFAIPILNVEQIVSMQEITPVPDYPEYVRGIIHMRGAVTPVLDFRMRMGKAAAAYNDRTCIIVVNGPEEDGCLGYIVDGVEEVMEIEDGQISIPPKVKGKEGREFVTGIFRQMRKSGNGEQLVLCVDSVKVAGADVVGRESQRIR